MGVYFKCAMRELLRRKKRSLVTIISYFFAIVILVVLLSVVLLSTDASDNIMTTTGTHFMFYSPVQTGAGAECPVGCVTAQFKEYDEASLKPYDQKAEGFIADSLFTNLFQQPVIEEIRKIDYVRDASAYLLFRLKSVEDRHVYSVGGIDTTNTVAVYTTTCSPNDLIDGRFLSPQDKDVVMVEAGYAKARSLAVGQQVEVSGVDYPIVGIVNSGIRPGKADIYMSFQDAETAINRRLETPIANLFNVVLVEVANAKYQPQVMNDVKTLTNGVVSTYNCYVPAAQVLGINENFISLFVILLAAAFFIIIVKGQYSNVVERRREIGILKVVGWTNGQIAAEIMTESVLTALIGGLCGSVVSMLVLWLVPIGEIVSPGTPLNITATWLTLAIGMGMALVGGILAGLLPALRSARENPADAIRNL